MAQNGVVAFAFYRESLDGTLHRRGESGRSDVLLPDGEWSPHMLEWATASVTELSREEAQAVADQYVHAGVRTPVDLDAPGLQLRAGAEVPGAGSTMRARADASQPDSQPSPPPAPPWPTDPAFNERVRRWVNPKPREEPPDDLDDAAFALTNLARHMRLAREADERAKAERQAPDDTSDEGGGTEVPPTSGDSRSA